VTKSILAFAGFFRICEVLGVKRSDIKFSETYCEIYIKNRKQMVEHKTSVVITRTGSSFVWLDFYKDIWKKKNNIF
jgi:hypothetical protein